MPSPKRESGGFSYLQSKPTPTPPLSPTGAPAETGGEGAAKPVAKRPFLKRSTTPRAAAAAARANNNNNNLLQQQERAPLLSEVPTSSTAIAPAAPSARKVPAAVSTTKATTVPPQSSSLVKDLPLSMRRSIERFAEDPADASEPLPLPTPPLPPINTSPRSSGKRGSDKQNSGEAVPAGSSSPVKPSRKSGRSSAVIVESPVVEDNAVASGRPSAATRESVGRKSFQRRQNDANAFRAALSFLLSFAAIFTVVLILVGIVIMCAMPIFAIRSQSADDDLTRAAVLSLTAFQAVYQQPYMGLNASETRCLYKTVLRDSIDRLDLAVTSVNEKLAHEHPSYVKQRQWQRNIARAYHMARHRSRLYARSRDHSYVNQWVLYPLRDAWVYGVARHGLLQSLKSMLLKPSLVDLQRRTWDVMSCLRQSEHIPCPSVSYLEEKAAVRYAAARRGEQEPGLLDDSSAWEKPGQIEGVEATAVGSDGTSSLEFDTFVAKYIMESSSRSNREYDEYCPEHGHTAKN